MVYISNKQKNNKKWREEFRPARNFRTKGTLSFPLPRIPQTRHWRSQLSGKANRNRQKGAPRKACSL